VEAKRNKSKTSVFGIVNISPESFSYALNPADSFNSQKTLDLACNLFHAVDVLDIGAVSTRPNSSLIDEALELKRYQDFLPRLLAMQPQAKISLDCFRHQVLKPLVESYPVAYINDVTGFSDPKIIELVAASDAQAIVMHSAGQVPALTNVADDYYLSRHCEPAGRSNPSGLSTELLEFFAGIIAKADSYGLKREQLIFDPGLGFAKNLRHSLELLALIPDLRAEFGIPILIGASRKSFLMRWFEAALSRLGARDYKHGLLSALLEIAEEESGLSLDQDLIAAGVFKQFPTDDTERDELELRDKLRNLYSHLALTGGSNALRLHDLRALPRLI